MIFRPLGNRILVKLEPMVEKKGLIELPNKHREQSRVGVAVAIGPDVLHIKKGDRLVLSYYTGVGLDFWNEEMEVTTDKIVSEEEVLAIAEE
jgi:co-chaperonin GroES (HSP10)